MSDVTELVFRIIGENIEVLDQTGKKLGEVVTKAQDAGGATAELGRGGAAALAQLQAAATEAAKAVQALGGIATQAHGNVRGLADAATKAQTEAKGLGQALGVSAQSATTLAGAADQASVKLGGVREQASGGVAGLRAYAAEMEVATAAGIGLTAAVGGAAYVIAKSAQENVRRVSELNDLALASGLTARELSQLEYVARVHQVTLGALGGGYVALNRSVAEAANGAGRDAQVFKALDVDVRNSNGTLRDNTAILRDLADRFNQLPNGIEKSAAASALFAGNADAMLKVMQGGSAEFDRLIGRADALGYALDDKTATSAVRISDALERTTAAAYGIGIAIGQPVLGPLASFAEGLASVAEAANTLTRDAAPGVIGGVFQAIGAYAEANYPVLKAFADTYRILVAAAAHADPRLDPNSPPSQDATDITGAVGQVGRGIALRKSLADALGRPDRSRQGGGGGGGGDNGDAALRKAEREHELEVARSLQEREQVRVALAERDVVLRGEAVKRAEEDLNLARQYGDSESTQLALAKELDDLERQRLLAVRRRVETEFEGLTQYGPVLDDQYVKLGTQLDVIDEQLAKAPDHVARLTAEFEKTHSVVASIGDVLSTSLNRAVDGLLAQSGANFDLGNVLIGSGRAATSDFAGNFIKGINFKGLAGNVGSLFGGEGGGNEVLSSDALGNLGAAAASWGVTVALDLALNGQGRGRELFRNTNLLRTTLDRGDVVNAIGGGGIVGGLAKFHVENPWFDYLLGGGLFQTFGIGNAPTGGTQRAMALEKILKQLGLPQQAVYGVGEGGIRAQFLTNAPDAAAAAAFARAGFGFDIPGLRQPTIEDLVTPGRNGATYAHSPNRVGAALDLLQQGAIDRPGVEALRTNEALGLGLVLSGGTRRGVNVANLLTNNLLLTGVSEGEARRQLQKIAEAQGVTLESGIEEAQRLYAEKRLRDNPKTPENEAKTQLFTAVGGLVGLFKDDLPAGVDVSAIAIKNFTDEAGIDIDAFNKELERSIDIFGRLEETEKQGLRTGLDTAVDALARRNGLLAGGGSVSDIIKAGVDARRGIVGSLYEAVSDGFSTAITDGLQDAIQDSPEWKALTDRIAGAVNGAPLGDIPALIGDLVDASLPQIEAAAQAVAALRSQIGVAPSSLYQSADSLRTQVKDARYNLLSPRQQQSAITTELTSLNARIDAIEAGGVTPDEAVILKPLLDRRAQLGFDYANLAGQIYAPGSEAGRRAAEYGLSIVEDTAKLFEQLGDSQTKQIDATKEATSATVELTGAVKELTRVMRGPKTVTPHGGGAHEIDSYFINDKASSAARNKLRSLAGGR